MLHLHARCFGDHFTTLSHSKASMGRTADAITTRVQTHFGVLLLLAPLFVFVFEAVKREQNHLVLKRVR